MKLTIAEQKPAFFYLLSGIFFFGEIIFKFIKFCKKFFCGFDLPNS